MIVTDEMREDAALLCAIMASTDPHDAFSRPCDEVGVDCFDMTGAAELARLAAWQDHDPHSDTRAWWAEAEAKLRCGWTPTADRNGVPF